MNGIKITALATIDVNHFHVCRLHARNDTRLVNSRLAKMIWSQAHATACDVFPRSTTSN